jgi:hypothetical protein
VPLLEHVPDFASGTYLMRTKSGSHYLVDYDQMTLLRVASPSTSGESTLRNDGEEIDILDMSTCHVGLGMLFLVDLHIPGVPFTMRPTTPVVSVERVDLTQIELEQWAGE